MALPDSRGIISGGSLPSSRGLLQPPSITRAERLRRRQQQRINRALSPVETLLGIGLQLGRQFQDLGFKREYQQRQKRFSDLMTSGRVMEAQPERERMEMTEGRYVNFLTREFGVSPREAQMYARALLSPETKGKRGLVASTLLTPLELATKTLSVPGNILGNILIGSREGWEKNDLDPWSVKGAWEQAKGAVGGVAESPWGGNKLAEYWANVAQNEEAPAFLKNRIVQFGMTMATDPVMYLSFGATPMTKSLGMNILNQSNKRAAYVAERIMNSGGRGQYFKDSGLEWRGPGKVVVPGTEHELSQGELTLLLRESWGDPLDLLDAMKLVRNQGLIRKNQELMHPGAQFAKRRAGKYKKAGLSRKYAPGEEVPQSVVGAAAGTGFRMLSGALAPRNVQGGAGIRFAGREIPGTPELGHKMAEWMRTRLSDAAIGKGVDLTEFGLRADDELTKFGTTVRTVAKGLMPRWQLRLIADDTERAVAMAKWDKQRWAQSELPNRVGRQIVGLGAIGKQGEIIPGDVRANLLKHSPEAIADGNLKQLYQGILNVKASAIARAKMADVSDTQLDEMWKRVVQSHQDPLGAIAEFAWRAEARAAKHEFVTDLLEDPQFAKRWVRPNKEGELPEKAERSVYRHYGESVPPEYLPFKYKGRDYIVKRSVHETLSQFVNPGLLDNELKSFVKLIQTPQNFWKTFATVPNPSFHVMNFLGAVWNNLGSGVYNPADYIESLAILWNARLASYAQQGRKTITAGGYKVPEMTPLRQNAAALFEGMSQRGGLGRESIFQELVAGTHAQLPGGMAKGQRARELYRKHPEESTKRYAFRQARRGTAVTAAATGNVPAAAMLMMPEIAGVGRAVGTTIEDAVRIAPFLKAGKQHDAWAVLDAIGPPRVPGNMNKNWTRADRESMRDVGAQISTKYQFDYGDLTPFERNVAKTVFPFWTFYKNNFLLQVGWLANRPRFVYAAQAMENFISEQAGDLGPMAEILPSYFDNLDAFQIPVPESLRRKLGMSLTDPVFINPKLPFVSLNMMPAFWNVFNNQATTAERFGMVMAPIMGQWGSWGGPVPGAKMLLESWTNYNMGLNTRLDYNRANSNDATQSWVRAPKFVEFIPEPLRDWLGVIPLVGGLTDIQYNKASNRYEMLATNAYVAEQLATPFINNLGRSALYTEPGHTGDKGMADLISWLSGIRLMPLDIPRIHKSLIYDQIAMLEGEQDRLETQGKDLDTDDRRTLRRLRRYADRLNRIEDRREREVGG